MDPSIQLKPAEGRPKSGRPRRRKPAAKGAIDGSVPSILPDSSTSTIVDTECGKTKARSARTGVPQEGATNKVGTVKKSRRQRKSKQQNVEFVPENGKSSQTSSRVLKFEDKTDASVAVDDGIASDSSSSFGDHGTCLSCMDPMKIVSVAPCGHASLCGRCSLRLRICYANQRCPVCNSGSDPRCIIMPWGREGPRSFSEVMADFERYPQTLWKHKLLGPDVMVVKGRNSRKKEPIGPRLLGMISR